MCLDIVNRWKCCDNYTSEILEKFEFDRVKIPKLGNIQSLSQNEVEVKIRENIYLNNTMHFNTYVPSSGVNNEKLVRAENSQTHKYILKISMNSMQPTIPQSSPGTPDTFSLLKHPTIV